MYATNRQLSVVNGKLRSLTSGQGSDRVATGRRLRSGKETASMFSGGLGNGNVGMSVVAQGPLAFQNMLTGLVPENEHTMRAMCRDIYYYDSVAGSAVDMISMFPYSDYRLLGVQKARIDKYRESMYRLNLRSFMPELTRTYLVDGAHVSSLLFNQKKKIYVDSIIHNLDNVMVRAYPFYSTDPAIQVRKSVELQNFLNDTTDYAQRIRKYLSSDFVNSLNTANVVLDPVFTLYVARKVMPGEAYTSFLRRIIPYYLLERTLFRGTVAEAHKRQRAMSHIQMGNENWEPTPTEMGTVLSAFQQAEIDPLGAWVVTRDGIQVGDIRQGGEIWRWDQTMDGLVPYKLRSLGISEAFLSADSTFSNSEVAMSVFMENMDDLRSMTSAEVFDNKLFPTIALANGFFKKGKEREARDMRFLHDMNNTNDLDTPKIEWFKQLKAKREQSPMETLEALNEKGFPIGLKAWAVAGGVDIESMFADLSEDKEIRDRISALTGEKMPTAVTPMLDENKDEGDGGGAPGAEENGLIGRLRKLSNSPVALASATKSRLPLLARKFDGRGTEVTGRTKTGKLRAVFNQIEARKNVDERIVKAAMNLRDPHYREQMRRRIVASIGTMPNLGIAGKQKRGTPV